MVTQAAKRGPRTSTRRRAEQSCAGRAFRTAVRARRAVRQPSSGGRTEAAADAAQVDCASRGQQGAHGARVARSPGRAAGACASTRAVSSSGRGAPLLRPSSAAVAVRGRTASGCAGRRARAPRRGGSRRPRARRRGPGGWSAAAASRALVARHGAQNAVENWTTVRSASSGRTPERREARRSSSCRRPPSLGRGRAHRTVAGAQPPGGERRSSGQRAPASTTAPVVVHRRAPTRPDRWAIPDTGFSAGPCRWPRTRDVHPVVGAVQPGELQAEGQGGHGVPQVEQVAGLLDEEVRDVDAGARRRCSTVDHQLVRRRGRPCRPR